MTNTNLVAVEGQIKVKLFSWPNIYTLQVVRVKGLNQAEVKSKGERLIIKERFKVWPEQGSTITLQYIEMPE